MNYNDKNNKNLEHDDMNIKSHLNASLDLSGISVSEDLINRTLEAIKKQTAEQPAEKEDIKGSEDLSKKVISWSRYVRGFAGVAAAALIIVAGYSMLNNFSSKKSMENTAAEDRVYGTDAAGSSQDYNLDTAPAASGSDEGTTAKGTDGTLGIASVENANEAAGVTEAPLAPLYSIAADAALTEESKGTSGSEGAATAGDDLARADQSSTLQSTLSLNFRDIFLSDPTQAQSITITDEMNSTFITLTSQEEILDFYSVMDKHQFTYNTDVSSQKNYTVEIASPQQNEALYTMTIGSNIIVNYSDKDVASQSIYSAADSALLLQDLQIFYNKYYK